MDYKVKLEDNSERNVQWSGDKFFLDGLELELDFQENFPGSFHVLKEGKSYQVQIGNEGPKGCFTIMVNKKPYKIQVKDSLEVLLDQWGIGQSQAKTIQQLKAPMPGLILKVLVEADQEILEGDSLIILEAMKMENILKSGGQLKVKEILVKEGEKVEKGQSLIIFN